MLANRDCRVVKATNITLGTCFKLTQVLAKGNKTPRVKTTTNGAPASPRTLMATCSIPPSWEVKYAKRRQSNPKKTTKPENHVDEEVYILERLASSSIVKENRTKIKGA